MTTTAPDASAALELREQNDGKSRDSLLDDIRRMEGQYQAAMPRGAEATQLIRDAMTLLRTTKRLSECNRMSVLGGLMNIAQLGLRPAVLGQAWLLPFWDKNGGPRDKHGNPRGERVAQLVIGYRGYVELAHRSPAVQGLIARTAYENDLFEVKLGTADEIIHEPLMDGDRGEPIAYYAVVKYAGGGYDFRWMTHTEMLKHRDKFAMSPHKGPWRTNQVAMSEKTMLRQLSKYVPQATALATAVAVDESIRLDVNPETTPGDASRFVAGDVVEDDQSAEVTEQDSA